MSGDVVNLRLARKRRARDDEALKAEQRRAQFGRTKSEKQIDRALSKAAEAKLDAHRLDRKPTP